MSNIKNSLPENNKGPLFEKINDIENIEEVLLGPEHGDIHSECSTICNHNDLAAADVTEKLLFDQVEDLKRKYQNKKSQRSGPPYITYTEEELIYIPVIVWINESYRGGDSWSDAHISTMIDKTNEMLAGTYLAEGQSYYDYSLNRGNVNNYNFPGSEVRAIDDPNHGIDSGIRLRLMPTLPKNLFNPMFQMPRLNSHSSAVPSELGTYQKQMSIYLNKDTELQNPSIVRASEGTPIDINTFDTRVDITEENQYSGKSNWNTVRTTVANFEEGTTGSFTCGPHGAIIRFNEEDYSALSNPTNLDFLELANIADDGNLFIDGTEYEVYKYTGQHSIVHTPTTNPWGEVYTNSENGYNYFASRSIEYSRITMPYSDNNKYSAFESPYISGIRSNMLQFTRGVQYYPFVGNFGFMSETYPGLTNGLLHQSAIIQATIPAMHIFMYGKPGSSMAQFPKPNISGYKTWMLDSLHGCHWMSTPPITDVSMTASADKIDDTAAVLLHELGHSVGAMHAFQGGNTTGGSNKQPLAPFLETKKSWFTNADSFIPPFEYKEAFYKKEGEEEVKDYKAISDIEKQYLEMLLSKAPKDITNNYTRKIIFNSGTSAQDFFITTNYPDHLIPNGNIYTVDEFKFGVVLNRYLQMTLTADSLWGGSYILLDNDGNNVSAINGGKPELVVNPTINLIDGIISTFVPSRDATYELSENFNDYDALSDIEYGTESIVTNVIKTYRSDLGGYVLDKNSSTSELTILSAVPVSYSLNENFNNNTISYGRFNDWSIADGNDYAVIRNILVIDSDNVLANVSTWPFKDNKYYALGTNCRTSGSGVTAQYGLTYSSSGEEVAVMGPNYNLIKYCTTSSTVTPVSGQSTHNDADLTDFTIYKLLTRKVVASSNVNSTTTEVIPSNRKGPQITSRVPFCVPNADGTPSDVFDPFWFGNINWRDPKNRAYPENWPVSKLYDEFDANGDALCPCLYAEQSYYKNGALVTYTPINAGKEGFAAGSSSSYAAATAAKNGETLNTDALAIYDIVSSDTVYNYANGLERSYNDVIAPSPVINNAIVYTNAQDEIIIDKDGAYPFTHYQRDYRNVQDNVLDSMSSVNSIYKIPTGVKGNARLGVGLGSYHYNCMQYPHRAGYFFKNHLLGWKPLPGGYETDDPIHYVKAPMGVGYCGVFMQGSAYSKFNIDYKAALEESETFNGTEDIFEDLMSADYYLAIGGLPFNAFARNNYTEDLTTQIFATVHGDSSVVYFDYHKYNFGSTNLESPYYNPYRLPTFDCRGWTAAQWDRNRVDRNTWDGFKIYYGGSYNGVSLLDWAGTSPTHGDFNVGSLNNMMQYDKGAASHLDADDFAVFGTVSSAARASDGNVPYNSGPRYTYTTGQQSELVRTTSKYWRGNYLTRSAMTPFQIFRMRAMMTYPFKIGNWGNIVSFGINNNVSASYTESNTFAAHLNVIKNKIQNISTYVDTDGNVTIPTELGFYDPEETSSCDLINCASSTAIPICIDQEEAVCTDYRDIIQDQFLPTSTQTKGPKIVCPSINLLGCYLMKFNDVCEYTTYSVNEAKCNADGSPFTVNNCPDQSHILVPFLVLGVGIALINVVGEVTGNNYFSQEGQVYSYYEDIGDKEPVYYYNIKNENADNNLVISKKFEQILTNLIKITSFAK